MSFGVEPPLGEIEKGQLCNCPVRGGGTSLSPPAWLKARLGGGGELAPFQPSDRLSL